MFGNDIRVLCRKCACFSVITSHRPKLSQLRRLFLHLLIYNQLHNLSYATQTLQLFGIPSRYSVWFRRYRGIGWMTLALWALDSARSKLFYNLSDVLLEVTYESHLCLSL